MKIILLHHDIIKISTFRWIYTLCIHKFTKIFREIIDDFRHLLHIFFQNYLCKHNIIHTEKYTFLIKKYNIFPYFPLLFILLNSISNSFDTIYY